MKERRNVQKAACPVRGLVIQGSKGEGMPSLPSPLLSLIKKKSKNKIKTKHKLGIALSVLPGHTLEYSGPDLSYWRPKLSSGLPVLPSPDYYELFGQ